MSRTPSRVLALSFFLSLSLSLALSFSLVCSLTRSLSLYLSLSLSPSPVHSLAGSRSFSSLPFACCVSIWFRNSAILIMFALRSCSIFGFDGESSGITLSRENLIGITSFLLTRFRFLLPLTELCSVCWILSWRAANLAALDTLSTRITSSFSVSFLLINL